MHFLKESFIKRELNLYYALKPYVAILDKATYEIHTHATRKTSKLHVRQPLNENGKKMIKYFGAHIWNMLP